MSDKYTVKESALANCNFIIYENGRYYITIYDKENAELFCKLLNDHEARKSLPKINKRTKDFIIDYLEQRKKEHESNICGKSTDDYFKEYVDDYCDAIEIMKNLSEGGINGAKILYSLQSKIISIKLF